MRTLQVALVGLDASLIAADTYLTHTQPLDHHCHTCNETLQQSFVWINDTGYERGGPVVLFLGGPSSKFNYQTRLSQFVKYATIFQCTFLLLEHRFYGISLPESESPFSNSNLKYLTVDQALLDVDNFVSAFQEAYMPEGTKWILAGEAYGASLAAWYSQKYLGNKARGVNKQFVATVASSAFVEARTDFHEYFSEFENAATAIASPDGKACNDAIRNGSRQISNLLSSGNRSYVAELFGACEDEISSQNEFFFKYAVAEVIASSLELNTPPVWSVNKTCSAALNSSATESESSVNAVQRAFDFNMNFEYQLCMEVCNGTTPLKRVSEVVFRPLTSHRHGHKCVSFDEQTWLQALQNTSNPDRAWWWQRCTQLGQFHGTEGHDTVFFDDIDVSKACSAQLVTPSTVAELHCLLSCD